MQQASNDDINADKTNDESKKTLVLYGPLTVASKEEFEELFKELKVDDYIENVVASERSAKLRFKTEAAAQVFINTINNYSYKNNVLFAKLTDRAGPQQPIDPKTLFIQGFDETTTERDLYMYFSRFGFLRKVSLRRNYAFIQYDTPDEAKQIYMDRNKISIKGQHLKIHYANKDSSKPETPPLYVPLEDVLPADSHFWATLKSRFGY